MSVDSPEARLFAPKENASAMLLQKKEALEFFLDQNIGAVRTEEHNNVLAMLKSEIHYQELIDTSADENAAHDILSARNQHRLGNLALFATVLEVAAQHSERKQAQAEAAFLQTIQDAMGAIDSGDSATYQALENSLHDTSPVDTRRVRDYLAFDAALND